MEDFYGWSEDPKLARSKDNREKTGLQLTAGDHVTPKTLIGEKL